MNRSRKVSVIGAICELFPPYAPEFNPIEYAWSYLKTKPLANFAPPDTDAM